MPNRINKKGSQKDAEQKANGNYFFYDDGAEDDSDVDVDDISSWYFQISLPILWKKLRIMQ